LASGVLAVKLSTTRPEYLIWFRKEQLHSVTWAGDPNKPFVGDSPLDLSPRRSFAAWSEIVRGTALPWTPVEVALARAVGVALVDIIIQVDAVRLLIGENQLGRMRAAVKCSRAAVTVADAQGRVLYASDAFWQLFEASKKSINSLDDLSTALLPADALKHAFKSIGRSRQSWRGEAVLQQPTEALPLAVRVEAVLSSDGSLVGYVVSFSDLSDAQRAASARHQLESSLQPAGRDADDIILAILTNASMAAMDIVDGQHDATTAPQLNEVELSAHRASRLYRRIRYFDSDT
jgi:PAS domain-containing protein